MPAEVPVWSVACFGGPLHGQDSEAEEGHTSFRAVVRRRNSLPVLNVQRELDTIASIMLNAVNYQVIENQIAVGPHTRRIRCAIADNISRNELEDYRDYLHAELQRFERDMAPAYLSRLRG